MSVRALRLGIHTRVAKAHGVTSSSPSAIGESAKTENRNTSRDVESTTQPRATIPSALASIVVWRTPSRSTQKEPGMHLRARAGVETGERVSARGERSRSTRKEEEREAPR